ncbi:MAG: hypothetical protein CMJ83_00695 [Planctomycetes bacterium]|nr:hypothetical protein [Planctomycetota bacterium]
MPPLIRTTSILAVLCAAGSIVGCSDDQERDLARVPSAAGVEEPEATGPAIPPLTEALLLKLVPKAAAMDPEDLEAVGEATEIRLDTFVQQTFTVLWTLGPPGVEKDIRPRGSPEPSQLAAALNPTGLLGRPKYRFASVLHRAYIQSTTISAAKDGSVTGTILFRSDVYEGAVDYVARHHDGAWRIESFQLPLSGHRADLGAAGKWVITLAK